MEEKQEVKKEEPTTNPVLKQALSDQVLKDKGFIPSIILRRNPALSYINSHLGYN